MAVGNTTSRKGLLGYSQDGDPPMEYEDLCRRAPSTAQSRIQPLCCFRQKLVSSLSTFLVRFFMAPPSEASENSENPGGAKPGRGGGRVGGKRELPLLVRMGPQPFRGASLGGGGSGDGAGRVSTRQSGGCGDWSRGKLCDCGRVFNDYHVP
jgi:hypothetical protein